MATCPVTMHEGETIGLVYTMVKITSLGGFLSLFRASDCLEPILLFWGDYRGTRGVLEATGVLEGYYGHYGY